MKNRRPFVLSLIAPLVCSLALTAAAISPASAAGSPKLPVGSFSGGLYDWVMSPNTAPPGSNPASCHPSAAHPYPVVLVHGTTENMSMNFQALSPSLVNAGYCVYAFNYGQTAASLGFADGLGDIAASAQQLATEVNSVLARTGAAKVDIVGHSQGGMMPNYYIKFLGGASHVDMLVGLAPSNHGTTLSGVTNLGNLLGVLGIFNAGFSVAGTPALSQQEIGSAFQTHLFSGGDTVPGVKYWVIETTADEVVTPYSQAFLSGANNITIQKQCPSDQTGHLGLPYDSPAIQDTLNALNGGSAAFQPICSGYGFGL